MPNTDGRRQFLARVAANTLAIVERELAGGEAQAAREWDGLQELLGVEPAPAGGAALEEAIRRRTELLSERIRAGDADVGEWADTVRAHVRMTVQDKLRVTNPGYLRDAGG